MKIILEDVRLFYVNATQRRKSDNGEEGKFGVQVVIPKDHPQIKKLKKIQDKVMKEGHGEKIKKAMVKLPLRDGDEERDEEEYQGMYFFNANSDRKPGIVNKRGEIADPDDLEEYCYSGAFFNVSVNIYSYKYDGKKGVAAGLNNLMLLRKGERMDGSVNASEDFKGYASDDDDLDDDFDDDDFDD